MRIEITESQGRKQQAAKVKDLFMHLHPLVFIEEEQLNETPNKLHSNHKVNREREKLKGMDSELKCIKETKQDITHREQLPLKQVIRF